MASTPTIPDEIKVAITAISVALGSAIIDLGRLKAQYSEAIEALKVGAPEAYAEYQRRILEEEFQARQAAASYAAVSISEIPSKLG
jgi:hypothetical protein